VISLLHRMFTPSAPGSSPLPKELEFVLTVCLYATPFFLICFALAAVISFRHLQRVGTSAQIRSVS